MRIGKSEAQKIEKKCLIEKGKILHSENLFRILAEQSSDIIFISNREGLVIYVNPALEKCLGLKPDEMIGTIQFDIIHPDDLNSIMNAIDTLLSDLNAPVQHREVRLRHKDGSWRIFDAVGSMLTRNNVIEHIMIELRDITERKKMEEELLFIKKAMEDSSDAIGIKDLQRDQFYMNKAIIELFEYTPEELRAAGGATAIYVNKDIAREVLDTIRAGKSWNGETEMVSKSGREIPVILRADAIKDEKGKTVGIIGVHTDITERKRAEVQLEQTLERLRNAIEATVKVLVSALESRDPYTAGHQSRCAKLACAIAQEMGLDKEKIEGILMAGVIHDIGKLSVPSEILSKPTKLTNLEYLLIKQHSQSGYEMLKHVESPWPLAQIVHQHHERMDGSGYPHNLKNDEIIIEARILAVADVVEAMASHRPYRQALGIEKALEEIEKNKGILYDESVAAACLRLFREKDYQLT